MTLHTLEALENRRLLSVTITEVEPNNVPLAANVLPRKLGTPLQVTGAINAPGDRDWFKIQLKQGDVFGASLTGTGDEMDTMLNLFNSSGQLIMGNDDSFFAGVTLTAGSPLPSNQRSIRDSEIYCVITTPGTYYFQVSTFEDETAGDYKVDLVVTRPGMESKPVGAHQILYLDFNGGSVPFSFSDGTYYAPTLAPLLTSLAGWGLKEKDLPEVIKETVARVTEKLSTYIRINGLNGDYDKSGVPGQFDIEIRNSLQHPDPFGKNPLASRIIVGLTDDPKLAQDYIGLSQSIDIGNFKPNDQAAVSTNFISGLLQGFPTAKPNNKAMTIAFVAEYMSVLISHEFGHLVGCFHTQFSFEGAFQEPVNLMDKDIFVPMGPDLVFGTPDDITMHFGVDAYNENYSGIEDTLNTVAFGLSTGKKAAGHEGEDVQSPSPMVGAFGQPLPSLFRSAASWDLFDREADLLQTAKPQL